MTALLVLVLALSAAWIYFGFCIGRRFPLRGAWLWSPEQERAAWDRGRGVGIAEGRGELTPSQVEWLDAA